MVGDWPYGGDPSEWRIPTAVKGTKTQIFVPKCSHYRVPIQIDGGTIMASSQRDWKLGAPPQVDAGVYLDSSWVRKLGVIGHEIRCAAGYPALLLDWPDMGTPDKHHLEIAITWTRRYLAAGKAVEVACIGGHGRTGTFIGCLLREYGFGPKEAVKIVKEVVCKECIETSPQEKLIAEWKGAK